MPDEPKSKKTDPLNPSLPSHTHRYLRQLTRTGVHGKTPSEVARVLIYDQIKYLLHKGVIRWEHAENGEEDELTENDD